MSTGPAPSSDDPRVARTRAALAASFSTLLLEHGYDAVTPASIAAAAGIARSTFYVHFRGKPALLRHVLQRVLQPLADAVAVGQPPGTLEPVLRHFWGRRRVARALMSGRARVVVQDRLAELTRTNLKRARIELRVPPEMAAACIAQGQLGMLEAWLSGQGGCSASTLAAAMDAFTLGSVEALRR